MASNFLDQVLSMTGLKLPDTHNHSTSSVYKDETTAEKKATQISSVERYQQKKNARSGVTGTARYLAKKQQQAEAEAAKLTGVDHYLAKKQQQAQAKAKAEITVLAKMTTVEKYLFKLEANKKTAVSVALSVEKTETTEQSSVEKYLAKQASTITPTKNAKKSSSIAKNEVKTSTSDDNPKTQIDEKSPKVSTENAAENNEIIDLTKNAKQCQAATAKGTQCRRKTNLDAMEKMVNGQHYKFAVCIQHNNEVFVPFAEFLQ